MADWVMCMPPQSGTPQVAISQLSKRYLRAGLRCTNEDYTIENLGGPDTIRTCDLRLRRATLYPTELRVLEDA